MGRTKKNPVVWQDHHDEGAFRSTWTSQANPELFNKSGYKKSAAEGKLSKIGKDCDPPEPVGVKVKTEDKLGHKTALKDMKEYGCSETQSTMPAEDCKNTESRKRKRSNTLLYDSSCDTGGMSMLNSTTNPKQLIQSQIKPENVTRYEAHNANGVFDNHSPPHKR